MESQKPGLDGRICTACESFKLWVCFDKKPDSSTGHHSRCKDCISKQKRVWWKKKNMKKRTHPNILEFSNHDVVVTERIFSSQEKIEFEKALRRLVVDSIIKGRKE